jgi:hypothetical protein
MEKYKRIKPGESFGHLVTIERTSLLVGKHKKSHWICECECGNITEIPSGRLRSGTTRLYT